LRGLAETAAGVLVFIFEISREMDEIPKCRKRAHVMMAFEEGRERGDKNWVVVTPVPIPGKSGTNELCVSI